VANSAACGQVSAYGQTVVMVCSSSPGSGEYVRFSHDWAALAKGRPQPAWRSILRGRNWPFHNMGVALTRALWATSDSGARWQVVPLRLPLLP